MSKKYYLTTAIDYVNGHPHLGHAYEKVLADVLARTSRLQGKDVHFLTGLDEHGQKVDKAAKKAGIDPQSFTDEVSHVTENQNNDRDYDFFCEHEIKCSPSLNRQ